MLDVFFACATQWTIGPSGLPIGLRYEALPFVFDCHDIRPEDRRTMLTDLKICERAALDAWSRQRGQ